jgi:putative phosphoesterase
VKLALFSDIHGNYYALQAFIKLFPLYEIDEIIFCGDIFGYYYDQNDCIELLLQQENLIWLCGNHDFYLCELSDGNISEEALVEKYGQSYKGILERTPDKYIPMIRKLPRQYESTYDSKRIGVFHGTPYCPLIGRLYPDDLVFDFTQYCEYDVIILGHTHYRMDRFLYNATHIINPGSLGQPRDGKDACFAIFDTKSDELKFINVVYDMNKLENDILNIEPTNNQLLEVFNRGRVYV